MTTLLYCGAVAGYLMCLIGSAHTRTLLLPTGMVVLICVGGLLLFNVVTTPRDCRDGSTRCVERMAK